MAEFRTRTVLVLYCERVKAWKGGGVYDWTYQDLVHYLFKLKEVKDGWKRIGIEWKSAKLESLGSQKERSMSILR